MKKESELDANQSFKTFEEWEAFFCPERVAKRNEITYDLRKTTIAELVKRLVEEDFRRAAELRKKWKEEGKNIDEVIKELKEKRPKNFRPEMKWFWNFDKEYDV